MGGTVGRATVRVSFRDHCHRQPSWYLHFFLH